MWQLLIPAITSLLDKIIPDTAARDAAKLKLLESQQTGEFQALMGQIEINKEEAKNTNLFVSGWRPGSGWVCVVGLGYTFLFQPLFSWWASIKGWPVPPKIDVETLMVLLGGLLGIGGLRSIEKVKKVA